MNLLKSIMLVSLMLTIMPFYGQYESLIFEDINQDGFIDTLESYYDGGSLCGGKFIKIKNGKTDDVYEMDTYGCFNQIKLVIPIPIELEKTENILFAEAVCKTILPAKKEKADASLQWIIKASQYNKNLTGHSYFDLIIDPNIEWTIGKPKMPGIYYITIESQQINLKENTNYENVDNNDDNKNKNAYLIYYGHNHFRNPSKDSLFLTDSNKDYEVYRTSHGVLVKKGNMYKWVFISDSDLTGAPEKLRWESIKQAKLKDNYIIIIQYFPLSDKYNTYIVNIETGICGRLKINTENLVSICLSENDIFKQLEKMYLEKD